jgi:hypothetical protein
MASKTTLPLPLWRIWARTPRLRGQVQILVAAATRDDAVAIIEGGATVVRCKREVRS